VAFAQPDEVPGCCGAQRIKVVSTGTVSRLWNLMWPAAGIPVGSYGRPKRFGGLGKPVDEDGFSDHIPIGMKVAEAD